MSITDVPTILTVGALPGLEDPIVQRAQFHLEPSAPMPGGGSRVPHRIHASRMDGHWMWAHLLRTVGGWKVIAAGTFPLADFANGTAVCWGIESRWRGEAGDGFDRLSHEAYLQRGTTAHIRREDDPHTAYCGQTGGRAVFDTKASVHADQHCVECDARYRAENYGRVAVTY